jgi:thiol-disulfide isomerase/thioredoxin
MKYKYILISIIVIALLVFGAMRYAKQTHAPTTNAEVFTNPSYKEYTADVAKAELAAGKKVVIFFYADWCPECRAADEAFKKKADSIPDTVTVLRVTYNADKELERKYGVLSRHTFVYIDKDEKLINKWVSGDIAMMKMYVK